MRYPHVILVGPTNSGKSTQIRHLAERFPEVYEIVDVGQLLRERSKVEDALGAIFRKAIADGVGAPPELVTDVMMERIGQIIWNGKRCAMAFSRLTPETATRLKPVLNPESTNVLIFEGLSLEALTERSTGRGRADDPLVRRKWEIYRDSIGGWTRAWQEFGYRIHPMDANGSEQGVFKKVCNACGLSV
jgi:adenylate kinase family enzyme